MTHRQAFASKTLPLIVLLLSGASWYGCGENSGGDPPVPAATATATPQPTATPIQAVAGAGLQSTITAATVDANPQGQVVVTFTLTDGGGVPLTPVLSSAQNPQQARVRFTLAHLDNYSGGGDLDTPFTRYVNDINATSPAYDSGGTLATVDAAIGVYTYTFKTGLASFDASLTYTVGMQVDQTPADGHQLGVNPIFDFVPAGGTPQAFAGAATQVCNSCHDPLIAHGNRREVRLCTLCHTEAAMDPKGDSIDFRVMIHKIHRGQDLPSVADGPPGSFYGIYSGFSKQYVTFAQKDAAGAVTGVAFPRAINECVTCHAEGATSDYAFNRPAAAACAACHDDVNPSLADTAAGPPGTKHFQNKGYADGDCTSCHGADSGHEFDISIRGAHVTPERSKQLAGLNLEIAAISNHAAGQIPTVSFKITDNAGTPLRDLSGLNRVGFTLAGPTADYARVLTPTAVGGGSSGTVVGPDDAGVFQYTPATGIPGDATGTWSIGAEARRAVQLPTTAGPNPITLQEAAVNPVVTFTVGDSTAEMRRVVVDGQNCAKCHGQFSKGFSIHGNLRNEVEYCVLCHNPNASDAARRKLDPMAVADASPVSSIDFKVMIHKIHSGENLEQKPYTIYGFGAAPLGYSKLDFSDVLYPGDRRDCVKCHASGTYLLPPFPGTALGTQVAHLDPQSGNAIIDGRTGPIQSACTSCHDGEDAAAHAQSNTASDGAEACTVCHEEERAFPVSTLHAGRN